MTRNLLITANLHSLLRFLIVEKPENELQTSKCERGPI